MPSAPPGMVENGAPSFSVLGADALGLSSPATDLQLLPDGRILAVARREIALGDGVRWQVFRAADGVLTVFGTVAIDHEAQIYFGVEGGIARLDIGSDSRWRATAVSELPRETGIDLATMISVTQLGEDWYWHGGSGAIVAWRPGRTARVAGNVTSIQHIFQVDRHVFVSDQSSGGLYRLGGANAAVERIGAAQRLASETVTCTVPFAPGVVIAGTSYAGLKLFNGTAFQPFVQTGLLASGSRINDLCVAGDNLFAAAVDTVGVVFFDRSGRIVQVLERTLDHRLGRTKKLQYHNGVLWALLNEGVARIEFPSPLSSFEPLIASGLAYAKPVRHQTRLWLLADGRAMRGVYDSSNRLVGFEPDAPPGRYVFALNAVNHELFASSETGIFLRRGDAWELAVPEVVNGRIVAALAGGRLLYVGRGELGVISNSSGGYTVERQLEPRLGDPYNAVQEDSGIVWIELGTSRVARIDPRGPQPAIEVFDSAAGLTDGWVESYVFEGVARFHLPNHLFRFDEKTRRFVPDQPLLARFPQLLVGGGRPLTDPAGRLWYTWDGTANVVDSAASGDRRGRPVPVGFAPSEYTVEENGVLWMHVNGRLARLDARFVTPPPEPLRAIVTAIQFSVSNRHVFGPPETIEPVRFGDNSLLFHFAAPANPFGPAVSFEVMLEGATSRWISTGNVGSAAFNRLKEGDYVFRVRPVLATGVVGEEARVAFTVSPPWFRTPLAWAVYGVSAVGMLGLSIWFPAFLQRRENERLERIVTERTEALNASNRQLGRQIQETTEKSAALAASEERYRTLNAGLEHRVHERTAELSRSNTELQQRESLFRLVFEHAPVGISWKRSDLGDQYHFNATFRRILRLPVNAPADYALLERLVHAEDGPRLERAARLIQSGHADSFNIELRFVVAGDHTVWTSMSVAVVRDQQGRTIQEIGILEDITARKQAERELATTYKNLVDASRMAGMAEVATGVLHNVGNVLNSLNVSANLLANGVRQSKTDSLVRLSALLDEHTSDLAQFLTADPKGRLVPEMLAKLAQHSTAEREWLSKEIASMQRNIDHIKEIVAMQQSYATVIGVVETLEPSTLFEDALRMNTAALMRHDVTVIREYLPAPKVSVEKGKVLQILINLIRNAKYACDDAQHPEGTQKVMTIRVEPGPDAVRFIVRDNGVGIAPENLTRIFAHGFTTRAYGHGFGLHSSAIAAREMKGSLTAQSEGVGKGATFVLEIPSAQNTSSGNASGARSIPEPRPPAESLTRHPFATDATPSSKRA